MLNPRPPRILFLCHSPSRNGATILLLDLIRWLKTQVDWEMEVLMNGRGPMLADFQAVAKTTIFRDLSAFVNLLPRHRRNKLQRYVEAVYLRWLMAGRNYDVIYANTSAAWPQVEALKTRATALLWHVHELEYGIRMSLDATQAGKAFGRATRVVAVSNNVSKTLSEHFDVPDDKIDLVHGFIPPVSLATEERQAKRRQIRNKLGWPQDAFVVGGCGSLGWRKGTDLFAQIANTVCGTRGYETVRFLWVGGGSDDKESLELVQDVRQLGLQERVQITPTTADVYDFYCAMDVFALTSREDPFPLVMLEAAAHELPVVCFEGSGGGPEFASDSEALVAPYLDVSAFACRVMRLHDEPDLRERLGKLAARKVRTHFNVERQGPKLLRSLEQCLPALAHYRFTTFNPGAKRLPNSHPRGYR